MVSAGVCQSGPDCRQNSKANTDEAFVCSPSWILWRAAVVQRFHQHDRLLLGGEELIAVGPEQPSTSISRPFLPPLRGWRLGETRRWGGTRELKRAERCGKDLISFDISGQQPSKQSALSCCPHGQLWTSDGLTQAERKITQLLLELRPSKGRSLPDQMGSGDQLWSRYKKMNSNKVFGPFYSDWRY